jgi:hypothetical protein
MGGVSIEVMQKRLEVRDYLSRLSGLQCLRELAEELLEKLARKCLNIGEKVILHQSQRIPTGRRDTSLTVHDDLNTIILAIGKDDRHHSYPRLPPPLPLGLQLL